jgi:hypothetical protein
MRIRAIRFETVTAANRGASPARRFTAGRMSLPAKQFKATERTS